MAKTIITKRTPTGVELRNLTYANLEAMCFNLFMSKYKFENVSDEQNDYILRKFWHLGTIGAFIVEGTKLEEGEAPSNVNQYPNGMIAFVPYAPTLYNIYDFPIVVQLIQVRGATFIPTTPQVVNKDVVIGFCQRNKRPVKEIVEYYIDKIVDIEMTIRVQLKSLKAPWLIATTPENEQKLKSLFEKINNDDEVLYLSASEVEALKVLSGGNTYILDKLYQLEQAYWNDLFTYMGVNNLGAMEKKEHFITSEVDVNNEIISNNADNFLIPMQEWCKRITDYLGYEMRVKDMSEKVEVKREEEQEEDPDEMED